ncbi:MAG: citrate synthase/methylcitrate synthase [Nitrososphaerota archaeon]|nr:citrate synthase/methylcitrate synthase [Nitrososphaerota archaeon]
MAEMLRAPKGLDGVAVADTGIAKSDADGTLIYRGYTIRDLFEMSTFEESTYLILYGKLPSRGELEEFAAKLRRYSLVPHNVYELVRAIPHEAHQMDVLRTAVSGLGATEGGISSEEQKLSIIAQMPTLVANCYRLNRGMEIAEPDPSLSLSANYLYMLTGRRPDAFESWAFERMLILYLEHDLNASAFTVRVVASTLADVYSACTAGLAALKGPLHGGANEAAMQMLLAIGSADRARAYVQETLARREKIMGFGHRVYKTVDPRSQLAKRLLRELLEREGKGLDTYRLCEAVENAVWEFKKLPSNVDFYAAPLFATLGIPIQTFTPIFASSRVVGWVAHYDEQLVDNRIYRPDAIYKGEKGLKYVPLDER